MLLFFYRLVARLPYGVLYRLGAGLGLLVAVLSPRYRQRTRTHLAYAGYERHFISALCHAGRAAFEIAWIWFNSTQFVMRKVRVQGWELIEQAREQGRGVLILTPHLGGFEIIGTVCAANQTVLTALFRPAKKAMMQTIIDAGRGGDFLLQVPANAQGVRSLLRSLRNRALSCILPDQVPQAGLGVWVNFFGHTAYTMTLAGKLAHSTGAVIVLAAVVRSPSGFDCTFLPDIFAIAQTDHAHEQARRCNATMEYLIARAPEQYNWSYNRYKGDAPVASDAQSQP